MSDHALRRQGRNCPRRLARRSPKSCTRTRASAPLLKADLRVNVGKFNDNLQDQTISPPAWWKQPLLRPTIDPLAEEAADDLQAAAILIGHTGALQ